MSTSLRSDSATSEAPRMIGGYALCDELAAGGMATVHLGRLVGPAGFSRTVAIKRLHEQFSKDPEFVAMLLDEARLAARIRHPNVVQTLEVVRTDDELFVVMDYVPGLSLGRIITLARALPEEKIPITIVVSVMSGLLRGLHAAHEARDPKGNPLHIVHRDISPQNVLVGADGIPRVLDFGVAKAVGRLQTTRDGSLKGKLTYMPPEQLRGGDVTRSCDIYAAAVVLWEAIAGERLFDAENEVAIVAKIRNATVTPPTKSRLLPTDAETAAAYERLDAVVLRGLDRDPKKRFATAKEMASALERSVAPASGSEVSDWVMEVAKGALDQNAKKVFAIENSPVRPSPERAKRAEVYSFDDDVETWVKTIVDPVREEWADLEPDPPSVATRKEGQPKVAAPVTPIARAEVAPTSSKPLIRNAALVAIVAAIAITLSFVLVSRSSPSVQDDSRSTAASSAKSAPTPPMPSATSSSSTPTAATSPSEATSAEPLSHRATQKSKTSLSRPGSAAQSSDRIDPCDPPYTLDPNTGHKTYKLECPSL